MLRGQKRPHYAIVRLNETISYYDIPGTLQNLTKYNIIVWLVNIQIWGVGKTRNSEGIPLCVEYNSWWYSNHSGYLKTYMELIPLLMRFTYGQIYPGNDLHSCTHTFRTAEFHVLPTPQICYLTILKPKHTSSSEHMACNVRRDFGPIGPDAIRFCWVSSKKVKAQYLLEEWKWWNHSW